MALNKVIDLESTDPLSPNRWVSSVYTGVVPIVYKAQRALLQSLMESTMWSFLTITPLMIFVSRSVRAGLVAMIPNVVPVVFIFGLMGWMGIAIDIGSMMTASIAAFGLVPLLFATGPGSEIQQPLAVVVIGGLVSCTLLTLVLLPNLFRRFGVER